MLANFRTLFLCLAMGFVGSLVLTSCCDPTLTGEIAQLPEIPWDRYPLPQQVPYDENPANLSPESPDIPDHPLESHELLDIALRNNPKTRISWANARAAAYGYRSSQSTLYPNLFARESYCRLDTETRGGGGEVIVIDEGEDVLLGSGGGLNGFQPLLLHELSLSWLLLDFGGRCATIEAARQALNAANWLHNRNLQDVMINVLRAYYNVLQAQADFEAKEDDVKDAEKSHEAAERLFEAGLQTKVDVLLAKSNLVGARLRLEEARGLVHITIGVLANALGISADTHVKVASLPEDLPLDPVGDKVEDYMALAEQNRPDLAAFHADYRQRMADVIVAQSAGMPIFTLRGNMDRTNFTQNPRFNTYVYNGCLALEIPIFEGFFFYNETRRAEAQVREAYAALRQKQSDILLEVLTSYYAFTTAVETVKFSKEFLDYTQKTYDAAYANYKEGLATILDVLAAQSGLSNARAQRIEALTLWITSLSNLSYAVGVLGPNSDGLQKSGDDVCNAETPS